MSDPRLYLVKWCPWWILRGLWMSRLVERTTVFRWEVNVTIWKWENAAQGRARSNAEAE